jgi:hypothetical protein
MHSGVKTLLYCCFTAALLLRYCCFTASLLMSHTHTHTHSGSYTLPLSERGDAFWRENAATAFPHVVTNLERALVLQGSVYCCFTDVYCCFTERALVLQGS